MGAWYRARQFGRALLSRISSEEVALAHRSLPPGASPCFDSMPRQDRRHGLDVAQALLQGGADDQALIAAALLHDAGKARCGLTVFHRTLIVLLVWLRPAWLQQLAARDSGWRRPFWAHGRHAAIGAEQARAAGCSDTSVWLIRNHHDAGCQETSYRATLLLALMREDRRH
jgi:hypothetical protein